MDEARRFLRFVTPGLVFAVEVVILLLILRPDRASVWREDFKQDSGLAVLFGGLLASGGLGFIFSAVHHNWHACQKEQIMNHGPVLKRLVDANVLVLHNTDRGEITPEKAWIITTAIWHQLAKTNDKIGSTETRTKDLVDVMHSLGTARIASIFAPMLALYLASIHGMVSLHFWPIARFLIAVSIAIVAWRTFRSGYYRTAIISQSVIDQVLYDALVDEKSKNDDIPFETWPQFSPNTNNS